MRQMTSNFFSEVFAENKNFRQAVLYSKSQLQSTSENQLHCAIIAALCHVTNRIRTPRYHSLKLLPDRVSYPGRNRMISDPELFNAFGMNDIQSLQFQWEGYQEKIAWCFEQNLPPTKCQKQDKTNILQKSGHQARKCQPCHDRNSIGWSHRKEEEQAERRSPDLPCDLPVIWLDSTGT